MALAAGRPDYSQRFFRALRSPLFLAIAGLWIFLLVAESVRPCFFLHDDNATFFSGAYVHDFRVLSETGRVAEINFYQYGGEPFLEQGQTAVLYPPIYLGAALAKWISGDLRWTVEWLAAMHLTLGVAAFYFWLRQGGIGPTHAALGGLAWVGSPFVLIVGASWVMVTFAAAFLPLLFWSLDRLWAHPNLGAAFLPGIIAGLFFLQGVQWVVYALLFLGVYTLFLFVSRKDRAGASQRIAMAYYLTIAALVFLILTLPLILPMLHATDSSAARSKPLLQILAVGYSVEIVDLICAQFAFFQPNLFFGLSTVILFCPALLFLPVMVGRFFYEKPEMRQKLFPLLLLSLLALVFSTRLHVLLSALPVLDKFRWPFKVFLFADFFLIAALVRSVSAWAMERALSRNMIATVLMSLVVLIELAVSLSGHDENTISKTVLPTSKPPFPGIDLPTGRVLAMDDHLPEATAYRYFTHAFATYYAVPSLGGYNPLVGREQLRWGLGLDFPNVFYGAITPEFRKQLNARAVRFLLVGAGSPAMASMTESEGYRVRATSTDPVIVENLEAEPLAYSMADPRRGLEFTYSGNSMLIALDQAASPIEISVGPTDGWWYRIDGGAWKKGVYEDDRLRVDFATPVRKLEVSYFDERFREGLRDSGYLVVLLTLILMRGRFGPNSEKSS